MQKPSLLNQAKGKAQPFTRPDITQYIPKGHEDAVQRLVAAGMKMMYAPDMKDELMAAVESPDPVGKKLGGNAAGIVLSLMQEAAGKMPQEALFPAAVELMSECAEILIAAGEPVSHEDWKDGFMTLIAVIGKHLGGTDDQIMEAMGAPGYGGEEAPPDEAAPAGQPAQAMGPMPDEEMA